MMDDDDPVAGEAGIEFQGADALRHGAAESRQGVFRRQSTGAAVALQMAINHPQAVRSLTLYEPVAFGVLLMAQPGVGALAVIWLIATYGVVFGVLLVILAFKARSFARDLARP